MYQYSNSLIRQFPGAVTGNAAVGIQATVYVGETNTLAQLFEVGGAPKANPVTTDSKGFYSFSLADGDYRIVFSSSQFATLRISVLDGLRIREDFDALVASNELFKDEQQAAYDSFVLSNGLEPVAGSFEAGGTITARNQVLFRSTSPAAYFSWGGALPKVVPSGSTVAGTGGESVSAWTNRNDGTITQALANGSAIIAGVTAAEVAEAADIAIGNFVTPEQFFTGDLEDPAADWRASCQAAVNTGRRVLLSREYGLTGDLILPQYSRVSGISRKNTGFFKLGTNVGTNTLLALEGVGHSLSNFKVDGRNAGSAPSNRLHLVSISSDCKDFNISQVDCYNATGYGHVTFGSESNPQVTGTYFDCYAENCQVPFEQIGALDVSLFRCRALGVSGRTLSLFHPYAGSKRVTYNDCHGYGVAGAGIEAIVTNGFALGPFSFINSTINISGNNSAIFSGVPSVGDTQATVDMFFSGGSYKTTLGQSVTLNTPATFKAIGTTFDGPGGFNCPSVLQNLSNVELALCKVRASRDSATDQINGLITNGNNPKIIGGSVEAYNTLAGGRVAVLGAATISREVVLVPAAASQQLNLLAEIADVVAFDVDGPTLGVKTVSLPITTTRSKLIISASISNATDNYLGAYALSWSINGAGTSVIFRFTGISTANLLLSYRIGIKP